MTVIAWDGQTLAADKRAVSGGGIARPCTKIELFGNDLLAMTGSWDVAAEMREWYKEGANPATFPAEARKDTSTLIVISPGGLIRTWAAGPYPMIVEATQCAWGSGRDFAEAAMHLGFDAKRAVEVASHFQSDCGNGVDTLAAYR